MLHLNVSAVCEEHRLAGWLDELTGRPVDAVVRDLLAEHAPDAVPPRYRRPFDDAPIDDWYVSLLIYVNGFGGWTDALEIASEFHRRRDAFEPDRARWLVSGLAALILGLEGATSESSALAEEALHGLAGTTEAFFMGIRWASLQLKRRGRAESAERYLALGRSLSGPHTAEFAALTSGMTDNLHALIAVRRGQHDRARELVDSAVIDLEQSYVASLRSASEVTSAERARYYWMARVNRIQLDLFAGSLLQAESALRDLVGWSELHDPRAVHSTLSMLAFVLIRRDRPAEAVPVLAASLERLRDEYDPSVVTQVRKMLIRCLADLGRTCDENAVRRLGPYFWRPAESLDLEAMSQEGIR